MNSLPIPRKKLVVAQLQVETQFQPVPSTWFSDNDSDDCYNCSEQDVTSWCFLCHKSLCDECYGESITCDDCEPSS